LSLAKNKTVIIIAGPTAVGKTTVAIEVAAHFKTEIISADSRQCFKELNIAVARPLAEELQQVKHHFIATHSIQDEVNAVTFEKYALEKTNELFLQHDIVVMVGGTGLYIRAFCEGLDEIPPVKPEVRKKINTEFEERGLAWLQDEIRLKDPEFYKAGEIQNPQRLMRALEVIESTGQSILYFRKGSRAKRDFGIIKIGLELSREQLHHNINTRVDKMIENGLVQEVKSLQQYQRLNALQTVGYSEIFDHLDGNITLEQAISDIKTNTRQYAKRQMTWFKKDKEIKWFAPAQVNELIKFVNDRSF
jgi:tRNA dimethylallyltransferase